MAPFPKGRQAAISIVTVAELEMGVLAAEDEVTRLKRLRTLQTAEASRPIPITRSIAGHFAATVIAMRRADLAKLKVQDAWIAATALDQKAEVWTQDSDFDDVPGLEVVRL